MKHTTMTNYYGGDDDGYDNRNEDANDNDNAASGSGSDGSIFNPITTPLYLRGGFDDDGGGNAAAAHYIYTPLKMCYKLLYATFGFLDWCHFHMKKLTPVQLIIEYTTSLRSTLKGLSLPSPSLF